MPEYKDQLLQKLYLLMEETPDIKAVGPEQFEIVKSNYAKGPVENVIEGIAMLERAKADRAKEGVAKQAKLEEIARLKMELKAHLEVEKRENEREAENILSKLEDLSLKGRN